MDVLEDMNASMMVNVAHHCDDPNVGMSLTKNLKKFKLYLNDTDLFVTQIFKKSLARVNATHSVPKCAIMRPVAFTSFGTSKCD